MKRWRASLSIVGARVTRAVKAAPRAACGRP
jgi:hypothetical protein